MYKYPDECIRGIPNKTFIEDKCPTATLFYQFEQGERTDGYKELSITWKCNINAIKTVFEQKKKDSQEFQFKYGFAFIKKKDLDMIKRNPQFEKKFSYEQHDTLNNKYHGNLLIKNTASKGKIHMIGAALAMAATNIKKRTEISF